MYIFTHAIAYMWRLKDNMRESGLSCHHVDLRDWIQAWWQAPLPCLPSLSFKAQSQHSSFDQLVLWVLFNNNKISTQTTWAKRENHKWPEHQAFSALSIHNRQKVFPLPLALWAKNLASYFQIWFSNNRFIIYLQKSINLEKDPLCPDKTVTYHLADSSVLAY